MQLHRMTFQAVGPFPGRHTIDFAALGASGLFLLEGPTGSGKSTVIDALVFALYGKVAAADASEDRMRSDHARPEDETFVDLVFEVPAGVYRVLRTPRYARPKQRGSGTTTQQATVKLWRLPGPDAEDGELLSTRLDEAGPELTRAIGLDREQFVQTVVLPQGEFANFLRARPEDRRGVLQKVFGTEVYERVERRLAAMRAEANRSLEAARGEVGRAVAGFLGAARCDEETSTALRGAAQDGETSALRAGVDAVATEASAEATAAEAEAARAAQACVTTERARDEARARMAAVERRAALVDEQDRLAGLAEAHAADIERQALAARAALALPAVLALGQAEEAVAEARSGVSQARAAAGERFADLLVLAAESAEPLVQVKTLADERDRCTAVRARLDRALEVEEALPALVVAVADLEARVELRAVERDALVDGLAARPRARAELRARRDALAAAADGLGAARAALVSVETRRAAAHEAAGLAPQVAAAEEGAERGRSAAVAAGDRAAQLRQARIAGIAAELALGLTAGDPCPVCGGTDHPHPAAAAPEAVTADAVRAAEEACAEAERALLDAGAAVTGLRTRLEAAATAADGWDATTGDAALAEARAAVDAAEAAAKDRDAADVALEAFDAETRDLEQRRADLDRQVGEDGVALAERRKAIRDGQTVVDAAREGEPTVRAHAAALDGRLDVVGAWLRAAERLVSTHDRARERAEDLAQALGQHGFADAGAVRAAALAEEDRAQLVERVREHELAVDRVRTGLADPAVAEVAEVDPAAARAGLAEATAAHDAADAAASGATAEAARLRDRASASALARDQVTRAVDALVAAQAAAGPVVRMANVVAASGAENARQLSLGTYVLVRRFEDVVAAANGRLAAMSSGRYELLRSDERERGGARKLGLALKVVDHHTERDRDPSTLSGGETFYFALSLALGLADVVTAEAGGTDLGTLFVDEGFGSLDGDTLDVVLAELGRLRDGGRVVGVVSHVDAMKQAIAERVEVRPTAGGASTLAVRA